MEFKKDAETGNKACNDIMMTQGKQALLGQFHVLFNTKIQKYDLDGNILNVS
jgi:hypothetical protein